MENVKNEVLKGEHFTAINLGKISQALETANGKIFLKESTDATASEISIGTISPKTDLPFFHSHKQNEEIYIVLSGHGNFQVDDKYFPISEGSVIRVAPNGLRGMNNDSDEQMVYIVVQAKEKSLEQFAMGDLGIGTEITPLWK